MMNTGTLFDRKGNFSHALAMSHEIHVIFFCTSIAYCLTVVVLQKKSLVKHTHWKDSLLLQTETKKRNKRMFTLA